MKLNSDGITSPCYFIKITTNLVNKWIVTSHIHSKLQMIQREKLRLYKSFKHKETTISDKRMHQKHVENVGRFKNSSAIWINTGEENDFSVVQGLPQNSELVNEKYSAFMKK